MDSRGEIKQMSSLIVIEVVADLRAILAIVHILSRNLDHINVGTFCWISRPLDGRTGPTDAGDDTVK